MWALFYFHKFTVISDKYNYFLFSKWASLITLTQTCTCLYLCISIFCYFPLLLRHSETNIVHFSPLDSFHSCSYKLLCRQNLCPNNALNYYSTMQETYTFQPMKASVFLLPITTRAQVLFNASAIIIHYIYNNKVQKILLLYIFCMSLITSAGRPVQGRYCLFLVPVRSLSAEFWMNCRWDKAVDWLLRNENCNNSDRKA